MTRQDALRLLEDTLELRPNTLTGTEMLKELAGWDSMSTLTFIAMADKELGVPLQGNRVARCQKVADLLELLGIASRGQAA